MKSPLAVLLILAAAAATCSLSAQEAAAEDTPGGRLCLSVSYFGEMITHPGFSLGLEYRLYSTAWYELALAGRAGWYIHIRNHQAAFFEPGIVNRFTAKPGFFGDLLIGLGCLVRSPDGDVYVSDAAGNTVPGTVPLHPRLVFSAFIGGGLDFGRQTAAPLSYYIRAGVFGEYPYNGFMLPHPALESGLRFRF
ncbi:MAG: hypothetical protein E4H36_12375 [Spirochaetales bacterium]|nr:MAG: hypothetical protein E4H36_12375 [Spirochaetales bacterium]